MPARPLGSTRLRVPALGFGAFKIGRNVGIRYEQPYELPDEATAAALLSGVLDLGMSLVDTAPAYGISEERIGRHLGNRRREFVLCTKVGESFEGGRSRYDFSPEAIERSVRRSVARLGGRLDILLVHADAEDQRRAEDRRIVDALHRLREAGLVELVGFSGRSAAAARSAMEWADVLMVEYHRDARDAEATLAEAHRRGIGTLVKKALASGRLPAEEAISFALANDSVDCVVVGGANLSHLRANAAAAIAARGAAPG
ncbi:MAG TPA: aldo/keto reductase [Phycisphaerales bacterium]|nr:aldo/keto reductase [Phycisphaerales bacterium]HMP37448.1 aldo/keto reductase [Phycisphaerales bacterium]